MQAHNLSALGWIGEMEWKPVIAFAVSFGLAVAASATILLRSKSKPERLKADRQEEEALIDPKAVPEFKPTWRNAR